MSDRISEMPDLGREPLPERDDVARTVRPQDGTDEPELDEITKMPDLGKVPLSARNEESDDQFQ